MFEQNIYCVLEIRVFEQNIYCVSEIGCLSRIFGAYMRSSCDKWVPVTAARRVIRLRVEKWPLVWMVAAN